MDNEQKRILERLSSTINGSGKSPSYEERVKYIAFLGDYWHAFLKLEKKFLRGNNEGLAEAFAEYKAVGDSVGIRLGQHIAELIEFIKTVHPSGFTRMLALPQEASLFEKYCWLALWSLSRVDEHAEANTFVELGSDFATSADIIEDIHARESRSHYRNKMNN